MHLVLVISSMRAGGAEKVMADLACHWVQQGHKVTLVTFTPMEEKPFQPLDARIHHVGLGCYHQSSWGIPWAFLSAIFRLRKILRQSQPDRVLSFLEAVNFVTLLATRGLSVPVIVSERSHPAFHRSGFIFNKLRNILYPFSTRLIVLNQSIKDFFPKSFRGFTRVIPNPIKMPEHKKQSQAEIIKHIVTVGRLSDVKDQATLIKAFKLYVMSNPHSHLTIYGEGPLRPNLEALIHQEGLESHVTLFGKTDQIHQELLKADLFIFPSLYEGFPNALLEAMAVGIPVIASKVAGNQDIIQDSHDGLLFTAGEVNDLYQKMLMINDQCLREKLSVHGQEKAATFAANKVYPLWDAVCLDLK
ncbi:MAG: glycosyltransferase family 4 protein [Alphaproteobacteria bacterium]|nr:glycosyltransferase family 4 protein [Alphaproteobacteria bacterium]